ncbi:MAG: hypothetical protein U0W40_16620 [Acidimicrobiia bacterium]
MARRLVLLVMCALVVLAAPAAGASPATVRVAKVAGAGVVLVDGATGRTLYTLTDSSGKALPCTDACLAAWPALSVGAGAQATVAKRLKGVDAGADGSVSHRGRPLYLFSGDPTAGTANGNGVQSFGGTWKVVKISGAAAKGAKPAVAGGAATTATTNPVEGYGY